MSLTFDDTFLLQKNIGSGGLSERELKPARKKLEEVVRSLEVQKKTGNIGFARLPYAKETHAETRILAEQVAREFKTVVVIGIGGSDLGTRAVHRALNHQFYNLDPEFRRGRPRIFFAGDTTDPIALQEIVDLIKWPETALIMVSKSGDTVEQMSTFIFLRQLLVKAVGEEASRRHIITITDATNGALRQMTDRHHYRNLSIPADVGGRFSVLSSVGLFPLAVVGVDTSALLAGAAAMDAHPDMPARYALLQYLAYSKRHQPISVLMPYAYGLREVGFWFRQLWAESLGKRVSKKGTVIEVGPTPVAALGPTDQHSQVQLYREGPRDKVLTFITVKKPTADLSLPKEYTDKDLVGYLAGHSFNKILLAEQQSTATALAEAGRPSSHLQLDALNAHSLGELLYFFELATAYAGELFQVNAYDQPGVQRGKELINKHLGRTS